MTRGHFRLLLFSYLFLLCHFFFLSRFLTFFVCFFPSLFLSSFFLCFILCYFAVILSVFLSSPREDQPCAAAPGEAPGGRGYGGSAPNHEEVLHKSLVVLVNNSDQAQTLDAVAASILLERRSRES